MRPWRILASHPLFERRPWLTLWEEDVQLPDGGVIRGYLRTQARDYAMIFALLADGRVPMVCQYKHGSGGSSYDLPAGYLDEGESPLAAAQRELHEETGLTAARWEPLGHLVIDTNRGDTRAHLYLARDVRRDGEPHLDPTEELEVSTYTPEELADMVFSGRVDSLASVAGIMTGLARLARE